MQAAAETSSVNPAAMAKSVDLLDNGKVVKTVLQVGTGKVTPPHGAQCELHYTGRLASDDSVFDSSRERGEPFVFKLGTGSVIKGWDEAVKTMTVGERAEVEIAPDYAYGAAGSLPKIPANATLKFDMELISFSSAQDVSKKHDGSLMKTEIAQGKEKYGARPAAFGSSCTIKCSVWSEDRSSVHVEDADVTLVTGEALFGRPVDRALTHMVAGEIAEFAIRAPCKSPIAAGGDAAVALDAPSLWRIELASFENPKEHWNMSTEEKIAATTQGKDIGNKWFQSNQYEKAIPRYKNALTFVNYMDKAGDAETAQVKNLTQAIRLNLAITYSKMGRHKKALTRIEEVLKDAPKHPKGLYRRGLAHYALGDFHLARDDFKTVLEVDPTLATAAQDAIRVCEDQIKKQDERDRHVYAKVFRA